MGQKSVPVAAHPHDKKATTETIKQGKGLNDCLVTPPTGNNTKSRARVAAQTATQLTAPPKDQQLLVGQIRRPERSRRNHGPGSGPSVVSEEATSTSPRKEVAVDTLSFPSRRAASCGSSPLSKSEKSNMKIPEGDFLALPGTLILSRKIACFWAETNQFLAHSGM